MEAQADRSGRAGGRRGSERLTVPGLDECVPAGERPGRIVGRQGERQPLELAAALHGVRPFAREPGCARARAAACRSASGRRRTPPGARPQLTQELVQLAAVAGDVVGRRPGQMGERPCPGEDGAPAVAVQPPGTCSEL